MTDTVLSLISISFNGRKFGCKQLLVNIVVLEKLVTVGTVYNSIGRSRIGITTLLSQFVPQKAP